VGEIYLLLDEHQKKRHREIFEWLSAPDPARNYHEALAKHHQSTGLWVIHGTEFLEWMEKGDSFLCVHGIREFSITK
jgi:hypothetical protein